MPIEMKKDISACMLIANELTTENIKAAQEYR